MLDNTYGDDNPLVFNTALHDSKSSSLAVTRYALQKGKSDTVVPVSGGGGRVALRNGSAQRKDDQKLSAGGQGACLLRVAGEEFVTGGECCNLGVSSIFNDRDDVSTFLSHVDEITSDTLEEFNGVDVTLGSEEITDVRNSSSRGSS